MIGLVVIGVSLANSQRRAVWGVTVEDKMLSPEIDDVQAMGLDLLVNELPVVDVLPGEWNYWPVVAYDWLWWRIAHSDAEKGRRLLFLANKRLNAGRMLCEQGDHAGGLEVLTKAEIYLSRAFDMYRIETQKDEKGEKFMNNELESSAVMHMEILKKVEGLMPEELKPRVTALMDMPKLAIGS